MSEIAAELHKRKTAERVSNRDIDVLSVSDELFVSRHYGVPCRDVQERALREWILPLRYLRNFGTIGLEGQLRLLRATAGVVGVGGLGGLIAELLARMGVGSLVLVDADRFEDNNLNRQLISTQNNLGRNKVHCAGQRIGEINSGTTLSLYAQRLDSETSKELLSPCHVVADALDNVPSRFILQKTAHSLGIPMVHGAIGGFLGQVTTVFPGDKGLYAFYPEGESSGDSRAETLLGNPAPTPAMIASWQAQEMIKYLTGLGELLRNRMLIFDAQTATVEKMEY
ncbi:MAG: HesA/MoeB/ThiF family protein [Desulfohalobiaceae bacterium]|nr:HesA/MoeB/ThiF family protein [Desulfohalobiaceae bacterium]